MYQRRRKIDSLILDRYLVSMTEHASKRLAVLYDGFADTEVAFNANVILSSGLVTGDVHLKFGDASLPCVLYACSMKGARVIAEVGSTFGGALAHHGGLATLRLGFRNADVPGVLGLFLPSRVDSVSEYNPQKPQYKFVSLSFVQRAPDVLIEILGSLQEIAATEARRRDERIVINEETMKKVGLQSKESCVAIDGDARRCLLRDISFSGAKVLVSTQGQLPGNSRVTLKLSRCDAPDSTVIDGSVVRVEEVNGRDDIVALSIRYAGEPPISYRQRISGYFSAKNEPTG
jgi:hypothetical protein